MKQIRKRPRPVRRPSGDIDRRSPSGKTEHRNRNA